MSDRVECSNCPVSLLCYSGRLGRTWNEHLTVEESADAGNMLNVDSFYAYVCPQCGIMTVYAEATGLEVNVSFECCMRSRSDVQDMFRTQSRYSGSTLNRSQKNKGAFYVNPESGLEHQVWFLMDDPGPGDHIVAMQCGECKKTFEERVEALARRVAILRENVDTVSNQMQAKLGTPRALQREINKLAQSIGGEFIDVEGEIFLRERDRDTGEPVKPFEQEWDEDGDGFI